ncbi:hypothetical protein J437_LFUL018197 [Ladona fulva]|uniref:Uncharacterized protein n=1 Tax=Ladona fulva TaxID=123851 RepID=A0A8K0KRH9_LADFU|nr:hypothetical protein J437_LFUL018197 [Ladona fulva]
METGLDQKKERVRNISKKENKEELVTSEGDMYNLPSPSSHLATNTIHIHERSVLQKMETGLDRRDLFSPLLQSVVSVSLLEEKSKICPKFFALLFIQNGWPNSAYVVSKVGVSALTRIQQRAFDADTSRPGIVVNAVHPGYVDTDMTSHKGPLTTEEDSVDLVQSATLLICQSEPKALTCPLQDLLVKTPAALESKVPCRVSSKRLVRSSKSISSLPSPGSLSSRGGKLSVGTEGSSGKTR